MTINGNIENQTDEVAKKCYQMIKQMYSKDYSEIWNIFYAVHISEIFSLETNKIINYTPEPYFMIDLPIPENNKTPNLYDCFQLYTEGEVLEGENGLADENGKKVDIRKKISFWSFPTILVISFKRFKSNGQKNQIQVQFPLNNLNLCNYAVGYKKHEFEYDLFGVCNHMGGVLGGHYTCFIKNSNSKWYHFNDTQVTEMINVENILCQKAYCLFYRKKSL
jgi:ubiquitin C-terminal hydrolase